MIFVNDLNFPKISFDTIYRHFVDIQSDDNFNYKVKLLKANIEIQF